jgi:hypothetical protein
VAAFNKIATGTTHRLIFHERTEPTVHDLHSWEVERRHDGAVLVRVRSHADNGRALPDAVFAFRAGDPQFSFWEAQLVHREMRGSIGSPIPLS